MIRGRTQNERLERFREGLLADRRPRSSALLTLLDRCAVDWNGHFECRSPACPHCLRRYIARESRVTDQNFGYLTNDKLAFVSVVISGTRCVEQIGESIHQSREHTRKRIAACRAKSAAWAPVYLQGWHEIDAVAAHQLPHLPPERYPLIEQIAPLSFGSERPAWITTWHGILHTAGLHVEDIAVEFRRQWPLEGQVKVEPLDPMKTLRANLAKLTSYANKFECLTTLKDFKVDPWPVTWEVDFFGWLQGAQRNPFEALRLSVNPRCVQPSPTVQPVQSREAMPCLFSGVSTYESTGGRA